MEIAMKETLITLTSDIVAAHVSNNDVAVTDLPGLITNVYAALANLGETPVVEEAKPQPAVAVRNSVKPDYIVCLEDGKKLKMLKRYLRTNYNMSPEEYRARWGLAADYPMVAPNYAEKRRDLAKKIGLGRKHGSSAGQIVLADPFFVSCGLQIEVVALEPSRPIGHSGAGGAIPAELGADLALLLRHRVKPCSRAARS
jgi:predicted transcriptional regulator